MGGEGWLLEEGRSQTGQTVFLTPSPAQRVLPLWPLLQTPALTHTPLGLHSFALKDLPKSPFPCLASPLRRERYLQNWVGGMSINCPSIWDVTLERERIRSLSYGRNGRRETGLFSAESSSFSVRQNNLKRLTCPPTPYIAVRLPLSCALLSAVCTALF